ncbi:TolC family protein [Mucilaginibacter sp. X4EP1]|uniref:TolC family protein n=1 Tax=Mucilaginibacter sp. X4EP1 TaxID=2723092 RepID=UPI002166D434|nr:TolC family protein [Mucilaginibacter sp. X4EP1]
MFQKFARLFFFVLTVCMASGFSVRAQVTGDTLKITIQQAQDLFVKNNLQLIIQRYNIDNASAAIVTARLFPNPDFSFTNGIHTNDATQGPAYKDQSFNVSQLFTTAGKRNKSIQLAKIGVEQSKYQFFDLLRTLKFTLRSDFYTIYFQEQSAKVYTQEINSLSKTLSVFKEQYTKGNIAQKEVLRIQSQLYSLQAEYNNLQTGIDTVQSELKLLIKVSPAVTIEPIVNYDLDGKNIVESVPYQRLLDSAYSNRYDLRLAKTSLDYNNVNLQLQKATAVPDFSLSLNYDKYGGYGTNFLGAGIEFNLPFFNRNQGGIKQARIAIDQSKVQLQSQQNQVESDVATNYKGALRLEKLYNSFDPQFKADFNHLIQEVFKNYEKRNISMLEFLDFYDSFKTNTLQLNTLQFNRITSLEQLNYVTGTAFFNQ